MADQTTVQALETELAATKASLEQRFKELAELTRVLIATERERDQLREQMQTVSDTLEAFKALPVTGPVPSPAEPESVVENDVDAALVFETVAITEEEREGLTQYVDLVRDSDLFDAEWYLREYPDVGQSPMADKPVQHYLYFGGFEGRNPGPGFDSIFYYTHNPDVLENKFNPLVHYLLFGRQEDRRTRDAR